jgi:hypothetical protein
MMVIRWMIRMLVWQACHNFLLQQTTLMNRRIESPELMQRMCKWWSITWLGPHWHGVGGCSWCLQLCCLDEILLMRENCAFHNGSNSLDDMDASMAGLPQLFAMVDHFDKQKDGIPRADAVTENV